METLTAQGIIDFLQNINYMTASLNLFALMAGVLAHAYKKMVEKKISFVKYWTTSPLNSMGAIAGTLMSFVLLQQDPTTALYVFFTVGFAVDSLINRTEIEPA